MKKKVLAALFMISAFAFTACGSEVKEAQSTAVELTEGAIALTESAQDLTNIVDDNADELNNLVDNEDNNKPVTQETSVGGFAFDYNGKTLQVGMKMSDIVLLIGDANAVHEAASCAFEGMSRQYNYGSIEIITYEEGGEEICCNIYLNDDMVMTQEGLYSGMSKADMEQIYGTSYAEDGGICTYAKGGNELRVTIGSDNSVIFIEYALPNPQ